MTTTKSLVSTFEFKVYDFLNDAADLAEAAGLESRFHHAYADAREKYTVKRAVEIALDKCNLSLSFMIKYGY